MLSLIFSGWGLCVLLCILFAPCFGLIEYLSRRKHIKAMRKYQPNYYR